MCSPFHEPESLAEADPLAPEGLDDLKSRSVPPAEAADRVEVNRGGILVDHLHDAADADAALDPSRSDGRHG